MLKKLLKYDLRSIVGLWWILAVTALGGSVIGSLAIRLLTTNAPTWFSGDPNNVGAILLTLVLVLVIVVSLVSLVTFPLVTMILVYVRFYRNFYTDEGYLTFTLPVSRAKLFFEKTIHTFLWVLFDSAILLSCFTLIALIAPTPEEGHLFNTDIFRAIGRLIGSAFQNVGSGFWTIVFTLEALLLSTLGILFTVNLVHFCITVGAIVAKKAKVIAAIGIYYGVGMALGLAFEIVFTIATSGLAPGFLLYFVALPHERILPLIALLILLLCSVLGVLDMIFYLWTQKLIEHKLNLP